MNTFRLKYQWWWYTVRSGGVHQRTYLKRSDAFGFADVSQKIRGGTWSVFRNTNRRKRHVAEYFGMRRE